MDIDTPGPMAPRTPPGTSPTMDDNRTDTDRNLPPAPPAPKDPNLDPAKLIEDPFDALLAGAATKSWMDSRAHSGYRSAFLVGARGLQGPSWAETPAGAAGPTLNPNAPLSVADWKSQQMWGFVQAPWLRRQRSGFEQGAIDTMTWAFWNRLSPEAKYKLQPGMYDLPGFGDEDPFTPPAPVPGGGDPSTWPSAPAPAPGTQPRQGGTTRPAPTRSPTRSPFRAPAPLY